MKSNEELAVKNITKLKVKVCEFLLKRSEVKMLVSKQKSYTGNELICEIHQNTEVGTDFINRLIMLGLDLFSRQKEDLPPSQNSPTKIKDTGGIDKYLDDLDKWEKSFYCNECGNDNHTVDFSYSRTVANGDVYICRNCRTESVFGHKPNEDNY